MREKQKETAGEYPVHRRGQDRPEKSRARWTGFPRVIGPSGIKVIWWLGLITITLAGLAIFLSSFQHTIPDPKGFFIGLALLIGGNLFWRIICEGVSLFFIMYQKLGDIEEALQRKKED